MRGLKPGDERRRPYVHRHARHCHRGCGCLLVAGAEAGIATAAVAGHAGIGRKRSGFIGGVGRIP